MNLREVRDRIASVKNTQKITSAMKLVSAAKLRRAQAAIEGMLPYSDKLFSILSSLLSCVEDSATPYTAVRDCRRVVVVAVSSDTGLCGTFNANVIRLLHETVENYRAKGVEVELYSVGKKIHDAAIKIGLEPVCDLMEQSASPEYNAVVAVARSLMSRYAAGDVDRVEVVHSHFQSAAKQMAVNDLLLPLDIQSLQIETVASCDYIVEPGKIEMLDVLLPKVVELRLFASLLDSVAAEHAARVLAMQIATDNATDLISELTLEYNKGRQQAITNELLDIMSGSQANR